MASKIATQQSDPSGERKLFHITTDGKWTVFFCFDKDTYFMDLVAVGQHELPPSKVYKLCWKNTADFEIEAKSISF